MISLPKNSPLKHKITEEKLRAKMDFLKSVDDYFFLSPELPDGGEFYPYDSNAVYLIELATSILIAESLGLDLSQTNIYEFGAEPFYLMHTYCGTPVSPAIAHFFAFSSFKQSYFAIDPIFNIKELDFEFNCIEGLIKNSGSLGHSAFYKTPYMNLNIHENQDSFKKRIDEITLSYEDAKQNIEDDIKNNKKSLVISNQVFNDPGLIMGLPYWQLPGMHIHIGDMVEMSRLVKTGFDLSSVQEHTDAFKNYFSLKEDVQLFHLDGDWKGSIGYVWDTTK